jgi:catechol 2,3-dioxygenase-like lactoylglutathione lyase family enzyme
MRQAVARTRGLGGEHVENVVVELLDQFERGRISRRQLVQGLTLGVAAAAARGAPALAAPAQHTPFKAIGVNHISYGVADYGRTRDFYAGLFGMQVSGDNGKQCNLQFGDAYIIARKSRQPDSRPFVDHIAYTIDEWDRKYVEDELRRRGMDPRPDTDESFHVKDPDGYDLQVASKKLMSLP